MSRFRFIRDPLFLLCLSAYALNELLLKPASSAPFLHRYFSDLLLIPCALPPLLWVHRGVGIRTGDQPPLASEVALHLALWSVLIEWIGPNLVPRAVGDPLDVVAYAIGGGLSLAWWHRETLRAVLQPPRMTSAGR